MASLQFACICYTITGRIVKRYSITILVIRLLALEAHREIGRFVGGRSDQHAIGVDLVGEDHLLNDQGQIGQLRFKQQFRIGIQNIKFRIAIGKEDLLR